MKKGVFAVGCAALVVAVIQISCTCAPCQDVQENKELVLDTFAAINAGELDKLDDLVAEDYVRHSQSTPDIEVTSRQALKDFLLRDRETVPNQEMTITHLVAENDLVAFWATYTGVQDGPMGDLPATGRPLTLDFAGTHRIADGKIVETWVVWDNLTAMTQLGFWPPEKTEEEIAAE